MYRWENSFFLWALLILPLLLTAFFLIRSFANKAIAKQGDRQLINNLLNGYSKPRGWFKLFFFMLGLASVIIALANLQSGTKTEKVQGEGIDLVICLDLSNSMNAEDEKPDRLTKAKFIISKMIDKLTNDRIGIVVFGGDAFLQLPLTNDYGAAKLMLDMIDTDLMEAQGTAIGKAIGKSLDAMPDSEKRNRAIILVSDGENHEDDALGAAARAKERAVVVHSIGLGTSSGGPIRIKSSSGRDDFLRNADGEIIVSKFDSGLLQQVAASGGGKFNKVVNTEIDITNLIESLKGMEKNKFGKLTYTEYADRFQIFLALGLFFLFLEFMLSYRANKYIGMLMSFVERRSN